MWIKNKKYNDADAAIAAHDAYVKLPDGDDKGTDTEKAEATAKAAAKAKIDKLFPNGAADLAEADKLKADLKDLW
jgi:hypothetical protein